MLASDEGLCSTEAVSSSANTSSNGSMINKWRPAEDVKVVMAYCNITCRRPSHGTKVREISSVGKSASRPRGFSGTRQT